MPCETLLLVAAGTSLTVIMDYVIMEGKRGLKIGLCRLGLRGELRFQTAYKKDPKMERAASTGIKESLFRQSLAIIRVPGSM